MADHFGPEVLWRCIFQGDMWSDVGLVLDELERLRPLPSAPPEPLTREGLEQMWNRVNTGSADAASARGHSWTRGQGDVPVRFIDAILSATPEPHNPPHPSTDVDTPEPPEAA